MNAEHFHVVGNPENRRVQAFCEAAQKLGHRTTTTAYITVVEALERNTLFNIPDNQVLRLESPGENSILNGKLRELGGATNTLQNGEVRDEIAWMAGFSKVLKTISAKRALISTTDVRDMFDKVEMHRRLQLAGSPTPKQLHANTTLKHLKSNEKPQRVFIKPRYGSSASGVLACSIKNNFVKCTTSLEIDGERFFNSLKIRTYTGEDAEKCINFILDEGAVVQNWFPKATLKNGTFDLRILCIAGKASHIVVRVSRSPMTNLHLGNQRGSVEEVEEKFGKDAILRAKNAAEIAAKAFPDALYLGADVALNVNGKRAIVLEVNAFGDLLPGVLFRGMTTYAAEISAFGLK